MAPRKNVTDYLTHAGAQLIVDRLNSYWHSRGYPKFKAESYPINAVGDFGVRSNLTAEGYPRRC